ncbi:HEPN-associated N-terminal domain-containing protein [Streptomyces celluloflavus]|uniref:HEPN-associated N-terminal domain-containing protein n=1 Tax=Streptomyces celluloflavus TaxID=58344 RepID=UPI0034602F49|nr:HEPN-associated N-terminal domain-containing protein [Streptomyces celluloflavus]
MGAGDVWATQAEQGWDYGEGFVCAGCVDDKTLAAKIAADAEQDEACDYCERVPAAPIDTLLEAYFDGLRTEYALAGDELAYFEGELAATQSWDGPDLVDAYADVLLDERLQETVREAARYDDIWVERDFIAPREDEALLDGWERFSHQVKSRTRYVFWLASPGKEEKYLGGGENPAAAILESLGQLIPRAGLVRSIPAGQRLWRARAHDSVGENWTAGMLGTPLPEQARQPNRMSPAGIPLFYGADSSDASMEEVARHATDAHPWVTYAAFETTKPMRVVDFTRLESVPAIFDTERAHLRRALMFLHEFVHLISADAKGREHLDYVPTQIVTEYLLRVFDQEQPVSGLVFNSSAARHGGLCTVLDIPQHHCLDPLAQEPEKHLALRLVPGTLRADLPLRPHSSQASRVSENL